MYKGVEWLTADAMLSYKNDSKSWKLITPNAELHSPFIPIESLVHIIFQVIGTTLGRIYDGFNRGGYRISKGGGIQVSINY